MFLEIINSDTATGTVRKKRTSEKIPPNYFNVNTSLERSTESNGNLTCVPMELSNGGEEKNQEDTHEEVENEEQFCISNEGETFALQDVDGQGDCMYLAILQHPSISKRFASVLDLRRYLRKWVTRHEKEHVVKKLFEFEKKLLKPWKKRIIKKGVWGSTLELMLLTCAFRKEIITIGNYKNGRIRSKMKSQIKFITGTTIDLATQTPIYLYFHEGDFPNRPTDNPNHFAYLKKLNDEESSAEESIFFDRINDSESSH